MRKMRNQFALVTAAALAVAGFSMNSARAADPSPTGSDATPAGQLGTIAGSATQPSNGRAINAADPQAAAVRNLLGRVTDLAVSNDGMSQLSAYVEPEPDLANQPGTTGSGTNAGTNGKPGPNGATGANGMTGANGAVNNHQTEQNRVNPGGSNLPTERSPANANVPGGEFANAVSGNPQFKNADDINQAVAQFQKDWKEKYNSDFKLGGDNNALVFNDTFQIFRSDVTDGARTASDRIAPDNLGQTPAGNTPTGQSKNNGLSNAGQPNSNLAGGADMGGANIGARANQTGDELTVYVSGSRSQPSYTIHLLSDAGGQSDWKIALPIGANDQTIHNNLLRTLNTLHDDRANWPSDQNAAYRAVSRQVLSAFADTSMIDPKNGGATNLNNQGGATGGTSGLTNQPGSAAPGSNGQTTGTPVNPGMSGNNGQNGAASDNGANNTGSGATGGNSGVGGAGSTGGVGGTNGNAATGGGAGGNGAGSDANGGGGGSAGGTGGAGAGAGR